MWHHEPRPETVQLPRIGNEQFRSLQSHAEALGHLAAGGARGSSRLNGRHPETGLEGMLTVRPTIVNDKGESVGEDPKGLLILRAETITPSLDGTETKLVTLDGETVEESRAASDGWHVTSTRKSPKEAAEVIKNAQLAVAADRKASDDELREVAA
jgi:hypothetical protein